MKNKLMITMLALYFAWTAVVLFSGFKHPQSVKVSPSLVLEMQVSFPPPEQGMMVYKSDGLWFYDYGWKRIKLFNN